MDNLPFDILTLIPSYFLSIRDVASFSLVCKFWHETVMCSEIDAPAIINHTTWRSNLNLTHIVLRSNLKYFVFDQSVKWTKKEMHYITQQISKHRMLKIITIHATELTDEMFEHIMKECTNLHSVDFSQCSLLTDEAVKSISYHSENCMNLHSVDFSYCELLTDAAVKSILRFPNIQYIDFSSCSQLTSDAVTNIASLCPKLQHVNFSHCRLLTDEAVESISLC